jgi:uncharacterized protein involved in exopolysaccharide biosynthesis
MKTTNENVRLLKPLLRGLPIVVLVAIFASLVAKRYLMYATPMYESTSKIRLADTKDGSPSSNLYKDFDVFTSANKIGAEVEVIKSKLLIGKALDSLDFEVTTYRIGQIRKVELYKEAPFKVFYTMHNEKWYDKPFALTIKNQTDYILKVPGNDNYLPGKFGSILELSGAKILIIKNDTLLKHKPSLTLADNYEFVINSRQKLVENVLDNLDINSIDKEIPILRLNFKSPVPEKAADFVNSLSKTYVNDYVEQKIKAANTTVNFLDEQLKDIGGRLDTSENDIETYRDVNNIINIKQETETDLRKIADMKVQQTNVKMNLEAIDSLYNYMKSGRLKKTELAPNFEAYTDLLSTELVKKMKLLQAEKKDLLLKYTPEDDKVMVIDDKIDDITYYLEQGIKNTKTNLEAKYNRLTDDINNAEKVFIGLPTKERTLGDLNRNYDLNEQAYKFLHEKRTEAQIVRAANISFHRIISIGEVPVEPVAPNAMLIKILSIFLGIMGAIAMIYIVHAIKGKVNDYTTIEKNSSIAIAAETPMLTKPAAIRKHFHKLAIQLEVKGSVKLNSIVVFSSFDTKEGKSFNSINLAAAFAQQGKSVLVVDADGGMHKTHKISNSVNIEYENIAGNITKYKNTDIISEQLTKWKEEYDLVIIKNEPLNDISMGLILMKLADTNLFVLDSRRTPAKMIAEAEALNDEYQFNNMQFLLNRSGYNPNIAIQAFDIVKALVLKLKRTPAQA